MACGFVIDMSSTAFIEPKTVMEFIQDLLNKDISRGLMERAFHALGQRAQQNIYFFKYLEKCRKSNQARVSLTLRAGSVYKRKWQKSNRIERLCLRSALCFLKLTW